jgi:putative hydroxymethylpyrimidine transport system substrate-binding protein
VIGRPQRRALRLVAAALTVVTMCAACGSSTTGSGGKRVQSASMVLDFTPNAIHSGIYLALARHYDTQAGVALHVIVPGESTDAISLLDAGKVNFAILDIHDLALADAQGRHLVGIMAIVERPLASVIAQSRFATPRALDGQTIGVSGDPSDLAVLHSIVAGSGGHPTSLHKITIGYDAVPDLLSGKVAAATAFWNDEGVQLQHQRPGFHVFRVEDYGAPPYPELIVTATASELKKDPSLAQGLVTALQRGYEGVLHDPKAGEQALESQVSGLQASAVSQQLQAELPSFTPPGGGNPGALVPTTLAQWARWEAKFGIVKRPPDVATMFDRSFLK